MGSISTAEVKLPNGTNSKLIDPIQEISSAPRTNSGCAVAFPSLACNPGIKIVGYPKIKPHPKKITINVSIKHCMKCWFIINPYPIKSDF